MSVIEDTRKLMQDFLAPELREISARIDALEKRVDESERRNEKHFDRIDKRFSDVDSKIDEMDQRAQKRHEQVISALNVASEFQALR